MSEKGDRRARSRSSSVSSISSISSDSDEDYKNLTDEGKRARKKQKKQNRKLQSKERGRSSSSSSSSSSSDEEYKNLPKEERKKKKKEKRMKKKQEKENKQKADTKKKGKENQKPAKITAHAAAAKKGDVNVPKSEEVGGHAKADAGAAKGQGQDDDSDTGKKKETKQRKQEETAEASQSGKQKKEYKTEELRRLQEILKEKKSHIKKPRQRAHFPYVWTSLEPYYNTHTAAFLIDMLSDEEELPPQTPEPTVSTSKSPKLSKKRTRIHGDGTTPEPVSRSRTVATPEEFRHSYLSRNTAQGLCDPWIDLRMDHDILPKIGSAQRTSTRGTYSLGEESKKQKKEKKEEKKQFQGSTRLPKFPVVPFHAGKENATQRFPYQDIPKFRQEMDQRFSLRAPQKVDNDYKRTKDDFYRMELDKLDEIHPLNRPHMRKAYFAYLQNTPGSRKAVTECVKSLDGPPREKTGGSVQEVN